MADQKVMKGSVRRMNVTTQLSLGARAAAIIEGTSFANEKSGASVIESYLSLDRLYAVSKDKVSLNLKSEDVAADTSYKCLTTIAECNAKSEIAETAEAAKAVLQVIHRFEVPTRLSYTNGYAIVKAIVDALAQTDAEILSKAGVLEWFESLRRHYLAFMSRWSQVNALKATHETGTVQDARNNFVKAYSDFIDYINVTMKFNETEELKVLAARLNEMIAEFTTKPKTTAKSSSEKSSGEVAEPVSNSSAANDTADEEE